ncbi:hypothetical protein NUW54_g13120 [Trametes sanguinea]|uniref:Uncharacterized protein n=1 Tax=Trametes sanguinea TaxID=158606 RepID=A0ACC1MQ96_9APHY|nr:hypothetical protein NUW54_g13120 [Trametes sanguinea]
MPVKNSKIVTEGDPLAWVMAPPPNETEEQRQARIAAEAEAKRISDAIDEELQRQAKAESLESPPPSQLTAARRLLGRLACKGDGARCRPRNRPPRGPAPGGQQGYGSTPAQPNAEGGPLAIGTDDSSAQGKRPRRPRGRKFQGELTEGAPGENAGQNVPSSAKYRNNVLKKDDLTSRLIHDLSTPPYPDCLICFAPITPMQPTWSCSPSNPTLAATDDESGVPESAQRADANAQCCWMTFHLKCIGSWASKSVKDMEEAWRVRGEPKQGEWRCPGCQSKRRAVPSSYCSHAGVSVGRPQIPDRHA